MQPVVGLDVVGLVEGLGILVGSSDGCTEGALLNVGLVEGCWLAVGCNVSVGFAEGGNVGNSVGLAEGGAEGFEEGVEVGDTDGTLEGAALKVGWLLIVGA